MKNDGLSIRARKALDWLGVKTRTELRETERIQLYLIPNVGRVTIKELDDWCGNTVGLVTELAKARAHRDKWQKRVEEYEAELAALEKESP